MVQPSTNYSHLLGGLVEYKSELVAIAGYSYHVEVLQGEWQPFLDNIGDVINSFTTLVYADEIFVFGEDNNYNTFSRADSYKCTCRCPCAGSYRQLQL